MQYIDQVSSLGNQGIESTVAVDPMGLRRHDVRQCRSKNEISSLASSAQNIFNPQLRNLQTHEFSTAMIVYSTVLIQHRNQRWLGTNLQGHASV